MSYDDFDPYWEQDARNDRDEWDAHLRHVETEARDRVTRDAGESPDPKPTPKKEER